MKRYTTCAEGYCVEIEEPDGDWVRFEDAEAELAKLRAVVDALPKCQSCEASATKHTGIGYRKACDRCAWGGYRDLPYADALRALGR